MAARVDTAYVRIWGMLAGAVAWDHGRQVAAFEYDPAFLKSGLDLSPLHMPVARAPHTRVFSFPALSRSSLRGLPGLLADALPDRFGNAVIDAWLARQGRTPDSFSPVERLCYTGTRAMGALEFSPVLNRSLEKPAPVEVAELLELARTVTRQRASLRSKVGPHAGDALRDIIRVGTSAGGNRAKAVIALNDATSEVRSGQVQAPAGFGYWVLKFDGVDDKALGDPAGYGRIEYAYHCMAAAAGIDMSECRLLEEGGRAHFMTRRFDRLEGGAKLHMHSLCGLAHLDYNEAGAHSYEQAFQALRQLGAPYHDTDQMFRRTVFNVLARNQDDHTKNIAFLMDRQGAWRLSPAFDVTYAYNPSGHWTNRHQMTIVGKRDDFTRQDLLDLAADQGVKRAAEIIGQAQGAVAKWRSFAAEAGVPAAQAQAIGRTHRRLK